MNIDSIWYGNKTSILTYILLPLSWLFQLISIKRASNQKSIATPYSAPVIVIGNITVGGTGKTPMIQWLAKSLMAENINVGIVSRGYGGKSDQYPVAVTSTTDIGISGDEPGLLARSLNCPIVVDPDRNRAVNYLLKTYSVDVVLSDDGLQHYKMHRDMEIIMLDGSRGFGNQLFLPAGPLRENINRVNKADFLFAKLGQGQDMHASLSNTELTETLNLQNGALKQVLGESALPSGSEIHAVAGIGNPQSYFNELRFRGYQVIEHIFADHHHFSQHDFNNFSHSTIIMTEKDWVKCEALKNSLKNVWVLPVEYQVSEKVKSQMLQQIRHLIFGN